MTLYRHQFVLLSADGVPANNVTNTLYSLDVDLTEAVASSNIFRTMIRSYGSLYSTLIQQNNHLWSVYDMSDPKPRAPQASGTWNLTAAPVNGPLPPEVSLCLSFQGGKVSGLPQARRRGRIYIGPLSTLSMFTDGRPKTTTVSTITTAAAAALTAFGGANTSDWAVYSTVNDAGVIVTNGWVDNEFDTQRRRGRLYTARTTF